MYSLWQETDRRSQDRSRQSRKLSGRISLPQPVIPDDLAFWNSVSSLLRSTFSPFSLKYTLYIYIYIYCTRQFDQKCIYANVWSLLSFFIWYIFFSVLWFRLSGTFDSWFDSLSAERLATICSHLSLFSYLIHFPPHRSPLCMQYNIPHVFVLVYFFRFQNFVWINHVPHVME